MKQKGAIITLVLVFGFIFLTLLGFLLGFILLQLRQSEQKVAWNEAFQIAEAGVDYYRWYHTHFGDSEDYDYEGFRNIHPCCDNPPCSACPYSDFQNKVVGGFNLEITPPEKGSATITIRSTGWTDQYPSVKRTLEVQYGYPSWAEYAYLAHKNVWFGTGETIKGKIHSNGGIRFDATGDSLITSTLYETGYTCGKAQGCDPSEFRQPGIWGDGLPQDLWAYHSEINFYDINFKLNNLKTENCPEDEVGVYYNSDADNYCLYPAENYGYHLEFASSPTNTFNVYEVKEVVCGPSYDSDHQSLFNPNWDNCYEIKSEDLIGAYDLPENTLVYVQCIGDQKLWVDGKIGTRVTVIARGAEDTSIIINGDLTYAERDGSCALGLISQKDILIPWFSPDILNINGVFLAQYGSFYRPYYSWISDFIMDWFYSNPEYNYIGDTIKLYGSVLHYRAYSPYFDLRLLWWTFPRVSLTWAWLDGSGDVISGYQDTELEYNPHLVYNPPPYFPVHGEYDILRWEEVQ